MGDNGAGLNRGLTSATPSYHKIRRENDHICNVTDLSGNSREKGEARCVHTSVHVHVKLVFPFTSELQGGRRGGGVRVRKHSDEWSTRWPTGNKCVFTEHLPYFVYF